MRLFESTLSTSPRILRGVVDGINKVYQVQSVVKPGTLTYQLNGVDIFEGSDYTLDHEIIGKVTMTIAPSSSSSDVVSASYDVFGSVN